MHRGVGGSLCLLYLVRLKYPMKMKQFGLTEIKQFGLTNYFIFMGYLKTGRGGGVQHPLDPSLCSIYNVPFYVCKPTQKGVKIKAAPNIMLSPNRWFCMNAYRMMLHVL